MFDAALTVDALTIRADQACLSAILDGLQPASHQPFGTRPAQQALIGAFCRRTSVVLTEFARNLLTQFDIAHIAFVGDAFSSEGIRAGLAEQLGAAVAFGPFGDALGPAAGAALLNTHGTRTPLRTVSLGPVLTESDVKGALDNCRLDYVYEPDWHRLLMRTSQMLSRGNVIAWFNGPAPFGPFTRSLTSDPLRSIEALRARQREPVPADGEPARSVNRLPARCRRERGG